MSAITHTHTHTEDGAPQGSEGGATAGESLQVPCVWHQLVWEWSILRHCCIQDLHARVPRSTLRHQDQQGEELSASRQLTKSVAVFNTKCL